MTKRIVVSYVAEAPNDDDSIIYSAMHTTTEARQALKDAFETAGMTVAVAVKIGSPKGPHKKDVA